MLSDDEGNVFIRTHSGINDTVLSCFPPKRREAVDAAYASAPDGIISLINQYSGCLRGVLSGINAGDCWYAPDSQCITMDETMNQAEYADVLVHEMGHFIDHMLGTPSSAPEFLLAMEHERASFDSTTAAGKMKLNDMLDDLFNTGACYDRNVTDMLSALFRNDHMIRDRFDRESVTGYVAYYMHDNDYWDAYDENGRSYNKRGKEIFADWTAVKTSNYGISCDFVERWFPEISAQMRNSFQR